MRVTVTAIVIVIVTVTVIVIVSYGVGRASWLGFLVGHWSLQRVWGRGGGWDVGFVSQVYGDVGNFI